MNSGHRGPRYFRRGLVEEVQGHSWSASTFPSLQLSDVSSSLGWKTNLELRDCIPFLGIWRLGTETLISYGEINAFSLRPERIEKELLSLQMSE